MKSYTVEELRKLERIKLFILCLFQAVIDNDVYDWATCDNLSSQVIKNVLIKHPECIDVLSLCFLFIPGHSILEVSSFLETASCMCFITSLRAQKSPNLHNPRDLRYVFRFCVRLTTQSHSQSIPLHAAGRWLGAPRRECSQRTAGDRLSEQPRRVVHAGSGSLRNGEDESEAEKPSETV